MPELSGRPLLATRLDEGLFVNRALEIDLIQRSVKNSLNTLIVGDRGMGKTSLLHRAARDLDGDRRVVSVEGRGLASSAEEFLSLLLFRLEASRSSLGIDPDTLFPHGRPPAHEAERALDLLSRLQRALGRLEMPPIFVVDELDSSTAHTLFGRLRDELWGLGATWLVAASMGRRGSYLTPPADTFFETIVTLEPLSLRDSFQLLRRRLGQDQALTGLLDRLVEAGEGNPRQLISLARQAIVGGQDPSRAVRARQARDEQVAQLGDAARRLVEYLEARGPASASDSDLLRDLGWTRSRAAQVLGKLESHGIVHGSLSRPNGARSRKVYELVEHGGEGGR